MKERMVRLMGADHPDLGVVADARLGDHLAVVLSRGRFPKPYRHVDPNEDGVLAAVGHAGWLLAVADGHHGFDAARAALGAIAAQVPALVGEAATSPEVALEAACRVAREAVEDAVSVVGFPRADSRTALTLAVGRDERLWAVTYGDTVCVRERAGRAKVVGRRGWPFLGPDVAVPPIVQVRLRPADRVMVASDGLTTYLGRNWAARTATLLAAASDPAGAARDLVEMAMDGGAGDHVAVGVQL